MSIISRLQDALQRSSGGGVTLTHLPALTQDDELHLAGLARVMKEYSGLPRHAALRRGEVTPPMSGSLAVVVVQVLKPCLRGQPLSSVRFTGRSVAEAAHEAKRFVESILPCDDAEE
jgi:hypothetical protein